MARRRFAICGTRELGKVYGGSFAGAGEHIRPRQTFSKDLSMRVLPLVTEADLARRERSNRLLRHAEPVHR